jgi:hypothetical protein
LKKNIVVYSPSRFKNEIWLPTLWSQAKTYYEKNGSKVDQWTWAPCYADIWGDDIEKVKLTLGHVEPDVFAVSLYVWNYNLGHKIAKWVKESWPNCLVITGGPHQYFKYNNNWFRDHPYIDASLPGECYGELCIQQILDNLDHNNKIDFNTISDIVYPRGKARDKFTSSQHLSKQDKKHFDYQWSSFADQQKYILDFINCQKIHFPNSKTLAVFETTRGCPYGCTYCDWGGGISTTVIKKDQTALNKDLEFLSSLNLSYLYIADANLGIFGERDVDIIKSLVKFRKTFQTKFKIGYGGFAKTENKLDYIKQILTIDLAQQLSNSGEIKISMQSLDPTVLKNINRVNIDLDQQIKILSPLSKKNKLPLYVELILGLPGMTLEKFYQELSILKKNKLSVMWFEWLILPETPAYDPEYKQKFKIFTISKNNGWSHHETESDREIVIKTDSYSQDQYLQMLLSSSLYHAVVQGGFYKKTFSWIEQNTNHSFGFVLQEIYEIFFQYYCPEYFSQVIQRWNTISTDVNIPCEFKLNDHKVYGGFYFVALAFLHFKDFVEPLGKWLGTQYAVPISVIKKDQSLLLVDGQDGYTLNDILNNFMSYQNSGHCMTRPSAFNLLG